MSRTVGGLLVAGGGGVAAILGALMVTVRLLVMLLIVTGCLAAPAPVVGGLAGDWHGRIEVPGLPLDVGVRFTEDSGTIDIPAQGITARPLSEVRQDGARVGFTISGVPGDVGFVGTVQGDTLAGDFTQAGQTVPFSLARGALPARVRRQEPRPPLPYRSEDVAYRNGEVDLAGTLTLPAGPGPFTALLLVTGSGGQDRDETVAGHKPFLVLADALTRAGYAVLRVDDRGVGGSSGDLLSTDYDKLAGDIVVGVDYLRSRPDVERVGLLGHSEGGYLVPLAAQRCANVSFVVMMAGSAVPGDQVLELQERLLLGAAGLPPEQVEAQVATVRKLVELVAAQDYTGARIPARQVLVGQGLAPDQIDAKLPYLTSRYFRALAVHDPAPSLDALAVPVLALYGGKDLQVPADQSVPALRARLADNPDVIIETFPELNHLMQPATSGAPTEYATIETTLAPEVLEFITRWLKQRYPAG
ncbi:MAG: alpha/beta hydrolase family protein [Pseudonocardiaceae bacterium]